MPAGFMLGSIMSRNSVMGIILVLLAFAISVAFITYAPRHYVLTRSQYPEQAVWNDAELFVNVRSSGYARSELKGLQSFPILRLTLSMIAGSQTAVLPGEFTVYHYAGKGLEKDSIPGRMVQVVPVGEAMYFVAAGAPSQAGSGQAPKPKQVWRWSGTSLARVSGADADAPLKQAEAQLNSEDDEDGQTGPPQGWHRAYLMSARAKNIHVALRKSEATLRVESLKASGARPGLFFQVTMEAAGLAKPVALIDPATNGTHEISKAEFETLAAQDPTPRGQVNPLHTAGVLAEYVLLLLLFFSPMLLSVFRVLRLKSRLLANLPEQASFPNAIPEQFPALDKARLEQMTRALEDLGFKRLLDYTMVSSMRTPMAAFARLTANESAGCFAEINQVFPANRKPLELAVSFITRFDGGWQVSTGPRKPNGGTWILRLGRSVWQCKPGLEPSGLLQSHQQLCTNLRSDLGVGVLPARSAEDYFRDITSRMQLRRAALKKKWLPVILLEFNLFKLRPHLEWKGDWPKEASKRGGFASSAARA